MRVGGQEHGNHARAYPAHPATPSQCSTSSESRTIHASPCLTRDVLTRVVLGLGSGALVPAWTRTSFSTTQSVTAALWELRLTNTVSTRWRVRSPASQI